MMTEDAPLPPDAPLEDRVIDYVRRHVVPADPEPMAEALGVRVSVLKRTLGSLVRRGVLRRAGGGRFTTNRRHR